MAKKLIELQESEKQRKKLEEIYLKLKIQIDDQVIISNLLRAILKSHMVW